MYIVIRNGERQGRWDRLHWSHHGRRMADRILIGRLGRYAGEGCHEHGLEEVQVDRVGVRFNNGSIQAGKEVLDVDFRENIV